MTTPSTERKAGPLFGTGAQTTWPFTFKVFAATDIAVTIADSLGVETALTYGVHYTVTLNANQETSPGGTVTYPISGSPLPVGSRLVIVGNLPYDQPLDLPSGGNFSPLALENELDRIVMQIQQLAENTGRALQVSITTDADVTLPPPAASQLIGWDSTGENLENVPLSELGTAIAYGTYRYDTFTGDGATTNFALSEDPAVLANLDVSISGVVQVPGTDYSLVNGSLVFGSPPANGTTILARYGQALTALPDSDQITFVQSGAGAVTRTVQNKLREWVSVKDFGVVADDETAAAANNTALANAVASGRRLFWPAGVYTFASRIKVGSVNNTCQWRGEGIGNTILQPALTFTDSEFIRVEASTVDNDPTDKTFNVLFEDMAFNGRGASSRSPVSSILYGMYVNWAHFMKINRCEFYGFNGSPTNSSVGLYMGAWYDGASTFNQMNTIQECLFTYCSNGIISGGTNKQEQFGGDNNAGTIMNTRVGGFGSSNGYSIGIELKAGYTNRIVGCDVESNTIGIANRARYNYISETLAEQNDVDLQVDFGNDSFVSCDACNFPQIEDGLYQGSNQFGRNGYINFMQSLGAPENLLIDGTFESALYTSAFYASEVKARLSDASFSGAYNRNVLYATGAVSSATRANMVVDPNNNRPEGWHTIIVRAKRYDAATGSALRMYIDPATYTEQLGLGINGSVVDYLEIGNYTLVAGNHRSGSLTEDWRIYAAFVRFNGGVVQNIPVQIQGGAAVVDFVGMFKGMVGYIPAPRTQFDVVRDIGGISPGGSSTIADLNCYPTSCDLVIDSISVAASRRIAGLHHKLENGVSAGYSYTSALNNTWGYSTASTASNDHVYVNTQSKLLWLQRAAAHPAGTKLQTTIKLLPI